MDNEHTPTIEMNILDLQRLKAVTLTKDLRAYVSDEYITFTDYATGEDIYTIKLNLFAIGSDCTLPPQQQLIADEICEKLNVAHYESMMELPLDYRALSQRSVQWRCHLFLHGAVGLNIHPVTHALAEEYIEEFEHQDGWEAWFDFLYDEDTHTIKYGELAEDLIRYIFNRDPDEEVDTE